MQQTIEAHRRMCALDDDRRRDTSWWAAHFARKRDLEAALRLRAMILLCDFLHGVPLGALRGRGRARDADLGEDVLLGLVEEAEPDERVLDDDGRRAPVGRACDGNRVARRGSLGARSGGCETSRKSEPGFNSAGRSRRRV